MLCSLYVFVDILFMFWDHKKLQMQNALSYDSTLKRSYLTCPSNLGGVVDLKNCKDEDKNDWCDIMVSCVSVHKELVHYHVSALCKI